MSEDDLSSGTILDCPGGASNFGLTVRADGGRCISVDPLYEIPPKDFEKLFDAEFPKLRAWASAQPNRFRFLQHDSASPWRHWRHGAEQFLADYERSASDERGDYVAASLPELPFEDGEFSLALSGFLPFSYTNRFDLDFHIAAVAELLRVCRGEVRLHPLNEITGQEYEHLEKLIAHLRETSLPFDRVISELQAT
ncbi:class I SAM-dependent methyltransferase [Nocardia gamkensis]|uniref:Class I SAM-dependent methyltransferase n=1 Tax=Nocardia gamkensis TaxID=352869 RepID=A0A7X6KZB1_9NOCA|nr:class I SAM-dependent methyltransferase [Nocardia gamkensis]NKY24951.1 class I SAM-dependent methyltransferase [Nocardia gamkensis]